MTEDVQLDALADLLALVLSGRPERILEAALAQESPEVRGALARASETLTTIALAAEPIAPRGALRDRLMQTLAARLSPRRTAIVVIDMINAHLAPGMPLEAPRARAIVPALAARLDEARRESVPVVYVVDEHAPDDSDLDPIDGWGAHALAGSEGASVWPALAPKPGDHVVSKATYSAFTASALSGLLDALRVDTLVLTGCLTEIGLLATATDALQRGFAVVVPPDSQAGVSPTTEHLALGVLSIMPPYGPARKARLDTLS